MSALGQKRTSRRASGMSAKCQKQTLNVSSPVSGNPAPDRWIAAITPGTNLKERAATEMTDGEVCSGENKSVQIGPTIAFAFPNPNPYGQHKVASLFEPPYLAIIRASSRGALRECRFRPPPGDSFLWVRTLNRFWSKEL